MRARVAMETSMDLTHLLLPVYALCLCMLMAHAARTTPLLLLHIKKEKEGKEERSSRNEEKKK